MSNWFCWILVGATLVTHSAGQLTQLLGGSGYTTFNDVSGWANLALDIGAMRDAPTSPDMQDIYENGKNAKYIDEDGNEKLRSLASLSRDVYHEFKEDPMFNFYRHAFLQLGYEVEGEELGKFDEKPVAQYADTVVLDLLSLNKVAPAPEAVIIMNVWMYVVHEIYEVLGACQRQDADTTDDMEKALDIAAALWIGAGQEKGDEDSGNMLYNLAEKAGGHFHQRSDGQALVNQEVISAFESLKLAIGIGECANNADAYVELRTLARKLIGQMAIPFIQLMIHHIQQPQPTENEPSDNADFVELYAVAIGARVEACMPTLYDDMLNLFVREDFKVVNQEKAILLLQSVYSCVEVTCDQVGSYRAGEVPACAEVAPELVTLAGYPQTFDARPASRIDRDIEQIRILTKARANAAALDYYTHGYNAVDDNDRFLSLRTLATSTARSVVTTQFNLFTGYFLGDPAYADVIIKDALSGSGIFKGATPAQIAKVVSGVLTNLVMYMAVLERAYAAIATCKVGGDGAVDLSALEIDQAVAFYVGSIEGPLEGGRDGGQLLYAAAKQFCGEFGVCTNTTSGDATSNVDLIQAFKDVSDNLVQTECLAAEETLDEQIAPGLLVPLIQGTLVYAVANDALTVNTADAGLGAGYAYSRSILPLIDAADTASGTVLARNMDFNLLDDPVQDGPAEVFGAVKTGIQKLTTPSIDGECPVIGIYGDGIFGDVCDGLNITPRPPTSLTPSPVSSPTEETQPTDPAALESSHRVLCHHLHNC